MEVCEMKLEISSVHVMHAMKLRFHEQTEIRYNPSPYFSHPEDLTKLNSLKELTLKHLHVQLIPLLDHKFTSYNVYSYYIICHCFCFFKNNFCITARFDILLYSHSLQEEDTSRCRVRSSSGMVSGGSGYSQISGNSPPAC